LRQCSERNGRFFSDVELFVTGHCEWEYFKQHTRIDVIKQVEILPTKKTPQVNTKERQDNP
jgi:hypothetical protein